MTSTRITPNGSKAVNVKGLARTQATGNSSAYYCYSYRNFGQRYGDYPSFRIVCETNYAFIQANDKITSRSTRFRASRKANVEQLAVDSCRLFNSRRRYLAIIKESNTPLCMQQKCNSFARKLLCD